VGEEGRLAADGALARFCRVSRLRVLMPRTCASMVNKTDIAECAISSRTGGGGVDIHPLQQAETPFADEMRRLLFSRLLEKPAPPITAAAAAPSGAATSGEKGRTAQRWDVRDSVFRGTPPTSLNAAPVMEGSAEVRAPSPTDARSRAVWSA
jgi:hypothetical protein